MLQRVYNNFMDWLVPVCESIEIDESYSEDKLVDMLHRAVVPCNELPKNIHVLVTMYRHFDGHESFKAVVKTRNHDWRARDRFWAALNREKRYY